MLQPSQMFIEIDRDTNDMYRVLLEKHAREQTRLPRQTANLLQETRECLKRFGEEVKSYENEVRHSYGVLDRVGRVGRGTHRAFEQLVGRTNALAQEVDRSWNRLPKDIRVGVRKLHEALGKTVAHNEGVGRFVQGLPRAELEEAPRLPQIGGLITTEQWRSLLPTPLSSRVGSFAEAIETSLREYGKEARKYQQARSGLVSALTDSTISPAMDVTRREELSDQTWLAATDSLAKAVAVFDSLADRMRLIERTDGHGPIFGDAGRALANAIRQQQPGMQAARPLLKPLELQPPPYTPALPAGELRLQLRQPDGPPPPYVEPPSYPRRLFGFRKRR